MSSDRKVYSIKKDLEKYYRMDTHFRDGLIFNSTWTRPLPIAIYAHKKFIEANLGNPLMYPGTSRLHDKCINFLGKLLKLEKPHGKVLSGGTESNITALWIARKLHGKGKVIYPENVHVSILKAIDLLSLEGVEVPLNEDFVMDLSELEYRIKKDTICVVANAGSTLFGSVDPIKDIGDIIDGIFFHVDGAFGGFILPFMEMKGLWSYPFDFRVDAVNTFAIDGHKMGMSTIPAGILLSREDYFESLRFYAEYLSSGYTDTLLGTRCSASVAALYATIKYLGISGYSRIIEKCLNLRDYALRIFTEEGFEILHRPHLTIVNLKFKDPYRVYKELLKRRIYVSLNKKYSSIRLVFMPHLTKRKIDTLVENLKQIRREGD